MKNWFLIILLVPTVSFAANTQDPKDIADDFLSSVVKGNISTGYDRLFVGSSIPSDKPQAVASLKQQTISGLPLYGKVLSYEFINEEKFGSSIVRYVYVLKSEKAPLVWEFYFYKPKNKWFLANVMFNDQFTLLR